MIENPVERTAIHESGHAIVAVHCGVPYSAVEMKIEAINGSWHCGGRLRGAEMPELADNARHWVQLTVIMAGYAAESLYEPGRAFSVQDFSTPDDRDHQAALAILQSLRPPVTDAAHCEPALERAWNDARAVVSASWSQLLVIANALVRLSVRNGEVVEGLVALTPTQVSKLLGSSDAV
jgi:hypothetical protein